MKKLVVTALVSVFAAAPAFSAGTEHEKQKMEEGKQEMSEAVSAGEEQPGHSYQQQVSKEDAKKIQRGLSDAGFYEGEIDGIIGEKTVESLKNFQESKNITAEGTLNQETLNALGVDVNLMQAQEEPEQQQQQEEEVLQQEETFEEGAEEY